MPYQKEFNITIECITKEELLNRMNENADFVLVDTIGNYDGNKYKIMGSKTIHYPEVIDRRKELLPYKEIIIYCRHKDCVASKKVAMGLRLLNIPNVKVYEGGLDEWVASGLPLEEV